MRTPSTAMVMPIHWANLPWWPESCPACSICSEISWGTLVLLQDGGVMTQHDLQQTERRLSYTAPDEDAANSLGLIVIQVCLRRTQSPRHHRCDGGGLVFINRCLLRASQTNPRAAGPCSAAAR